MKGRYILLIISLLMGAVEVMAGSVTREQARQRAEAFLKGKVISQDVASRRSIVGKNGMDVEPLYVFNAEGEQGFVIVSGCDETEPILGYSHKGSFDVEHMPENVWAWMEGYSSRIETMLKTDGYRGVARRSQTEWQAIGPLLTTEWNQRDPYYRLCPEYNGEKCVTGCVATAMAQILYYLKCPNEATPSIGSFTTSELKIEVPELPSTTFDWEKMLPNYTGNFTDEEGEAVAKLMRYCGQAVHMDYTPSASSAVASTFVLSTKFGISKEATSISRDQFSGDVWEEILYKELCEGRAVLYNGAGKTSRHAFVCDGYDGNGLFHFNWGWGGLYDGFYLTNAGDMLYPIDQSMVINLKPEDGSIPLVKLSNSIDDTAQRTYTRQSKEEDFLGVEVKGTITVVDNYDSTQDVEYGWGLYKGIQLLETIWSAEGTVDNHTEQLETNATTQFGSQMDDGSYQLRQMYRRKGDIIWHYCLNAYANYYRAEIKGNEMVVDIVDVNAVNDFKVNSVSVEGEWRSGRTVVFDVNLTNTSDANFVNVFVGLDGSLVGSEYGCYLDKDSSANVRADIHLIGDSGRKTITICSDDELKNVVYSFEADIVDTPSQELSGNMTLNDLIIKDYAHYAAGDGSLPVTVVVKNEKDEKFDDQIFFVIGSYRDHYETEIMGSMSVVLEPGEEKAFDYRVKNLKKGQEYTVEACYFSSADLITLDSYKFRCFNAGLKVDSVYFNTVKTGRWSSYAYADVENTGDAHWDWLLMSVGEEETSAELDLNPGERGTVRFPIFMETPGDYEVKIYSSWGGEGVFYTGTISVGEPSSQELTCKTGFKDAVMVNDEWGIPRNSLAGTAPVVTLQVKNEGENVYDDDVLLLMNYYNEQDEHSEYEKFIHAEVTPGDGVDLAVAFPDMGKGRCYVVVYYYSNNDMVYMGDSECVLGVPVDIKGVRVERKDRHPMRVYGIDGRAVPGNAKLEKGIYIVEGKKFVVK